MSVGTITLTCLLAACQAGQAGPGDVWHMNQSRFSIPIKINPERRAEIKELILYASRDQGLTWDQVARCTPEKEAFPFHAQGDGSYWFCVAIVDQQNRQEPADLRKAPVGQKLFIDTGKPDARLVAVERQGDEVVVRYDVRDEHLDPASVKLEYRTSDGLSPHATPVATTPSQTTARFKPNTAAGLLVRLSAKDQAGNEAVAQQELAPAASPAPVPPPVANTTLAGTFPTTTPTPPGPATQLPPPVVPLPQPAPPLEPVVQNPPPYQAQPQPLPAATVPMPLAHSGQAVPPEVPPPARPLAHSGGLTQVSTVGTTPRDRADAAPSLIDITKQKEYKIDFEVAKFGPSGIQRVDVYVTTDGGLTWEMSKPESGHKVVLPGEAEPRNGASLQGSVVVKLPVEGKVYGITLVVLSRAGLSKKPPVSGTPPQVQVELDTQLPVAELYPLTPDPARRDALILTWKAGDKNLTGTPITLEWSAAKAGPWNPIGGAELPNTGQHTWVVTPDVPPNVFLRLSARDLAGNTAVAVTDKPVLVDLTIPEVNILRKGPAPQ